ncbi:MAG: hypothetical protein AABX12_00410 [Nanoarchaeota archaeon]
MLLRKEGYFLLCMLFALPGAFAISVSEEEVNASLSTLSISSATNLYAYEVNMSYTGSVSSVDFAGFLGSSTSLGYVTSNNYVYVYESRLDSTQTGTSGSGALFNVTHSGDLTVCGILAVSASGSSEYASTGNCNSNSASGSTQPSGSAGGGGGGSAGGTINTSTTGAVDLGGAVYFSVDEIIVTAILGRETIRTLTVKNTEDKPVVIDLFQEGFGNALVLPKKIELAVGEEKNLTLLFTPSEQKVLTGKILFEIAGERINEVLVIVNVRSENSLFDNVLTLGRKSKVITPGERIVAQVNIEQVGVSGMKIDVTVNYFIRDFAGNSYLEDSETFFVDGSKEYVKEFPTDNLPLGKYVLSLEIVYPGEFATSSAQFEVRATESLITLWRVIGGAILLIAGAVFFWAVRHKPSTGRKSSATRRSRRS